MVTSPEIIDIKSHLILEGIAAGDALGFPYEGVKPNKIRWGFIGKWGITSDDTQLANMALIAFRESQGDPDRFVGLLSKKYLHWFLCLPPTLGLATLRSCLKMFLGLDPRHCGVNSSGNGPLPRALVLGWELAKSPSFDKYIELSTRLTHTGHEALVASQALARLTAYLKINGYPGPQDTILLLRGLDESSEWKRLMGAIEHSHSLFELMRRTGQVKGVGGYAYHTLSAALWLFINRPYRQGMLDCVLAGGDTDSCAAILGGLWAARYTSVPHVWHRILDYPMVKEPSVSRFFFNILTTFMIFFYYVPKRLFSFFVSR